MALYSMNRVSSIAAVQEAQTVMEENELNAIMAELDEAVYDENALGLIEACIVIEETDHKMFNALIEKDFITVQNESVLTEAEAEEANDKADATVNVSFKDKIAKIVDSVISAIKNAFANIIKKLDGMELDKYVGLVNSLGSNFTSVKVSGRKIKDDATKNILTISAPIENAVIKAQTSIFAATDSAGIAAAKEEFNKTLAEFQKNTVDNKIDECFDKETTYDADKSYIMNTCLPAIKNYRAVKNALKTTTAKIVKGLEGYKSRAKQKSKSNNTEANAAEYSVTVLACKVTAKVYKQLINIVAMEKNEARKAIIVAAKAAKSTHESAEELDLFSLVVSESCDAYLFD